MNNYYYITADGKVVVSDEKNMKISDFTCTDNLESILAQENIIEIIENQITDKEIELVQSKKLSKRIKSWNNEGTKASIFVFIAVVMGVGMITPSITGTLFWGAVLGIPSALFAKCYSKAASLMVDINPKKQTEILTNELEYLNFELIKEKAILEALKVSGKSIPNQEIQTQKPQKVNNDIQLLQDLKTNLQVIQAYSSNKKRWINSTLNETLCEKLTNNGFTEEQVGIAKKLVKEDPVYNAKILIKREKSENMKTKLK